jgi:hypothetical protein
MLIGDAACQSCCMSRRRDAKALQEKMAKKAAAGGDNKDAKK